MFDVIYSPFFIGVAVGYWVGAICTAIILALFIGGSDRRTPTPRVTRQIESSHGDHVSAR